MPSSQSPRFLSFGVSKLNRAKKKSFAREAAYISRQRMLNRRTGRIHDFSKKGGLLGLGMVGWKGTVEEFASTARRAEKRCDAVEGRLAIAALPSELDDKTCLGLLGNLAQHLVVKYKVGVLFALHEPDPGGDPRNKHGHLIYSSREVGENGKSLGKKTRQWDSKKDGPQCIKDLRAWWSATLNAALEKAGYEPNVELRSYAQLGIERPKKEAKHDGIVRTAIRRRERIRMVNEFHESHSLSGNFMRLSEPELKPSVAAQTTAAPVPADTTPIAAVAAVQDVPEPEIASQPTSGCGLRRLPEPKLQPGAQPTQAHAPAETAPTAAAAPVKDIPEPEIAFILTTEPGLRRLPEPKLQPAAQPTQAPVPADTAPTPAAAPVQCAPEPEIAPDPTTAPGLRRLREPQHGPSSIVHEMAASDHAITDPVAADAPTPEVQIPDATSEPPLRGLRQLPEPDGVGLPPAGPTGPSPGQ
jgi:MobA/MobL family